MRKLGTSWLVSQTACLAVFALSGCGVPLDRLACDGEGCVFSADEWALIASLANPAPPPIDRSNRFSRKLDAIALGKQFFFDPAFSGAATWKDAIGGKALTARAEVGATMGISCATCHDGRARGADNSSQPGHISVGAGTTDVNASGTFNSAYRQLVFWNGRADSLWALNAIVAESSTTMNGNRLRTLEQIRTRYADAFVRITDNPDVLTTFTPPDGKPGNDMGKCDRMNLKEPFFDAYDCLSEEARELATKVLIDWSKLVSAYVETLVDVDSKFDQFVQAGPASDVISAAAKRGAKLFVGKGSCVGCHNGTMLSDERFHNIGVPQVGPGVPRLSDCPAGGACDCVAGKKCAPWGARNGFGFRDSDAYQWLKRTGPNSDDKGDTSRDWAYEIPVDTSLEGAWRTPSLRNVALTPPYGHDGAFKSLREVLWHYNAGGSVGLGEVVGTPSVAIKPLGLTEAEIADLIAFLESLNGTSIKAEQIAAPVLP